MAGTGEKERENRRGQRLQNDEEEAAGRKMGAEQPAVYTYIIIWRLKGRKKAIC